MMSMPVPLGIPENLLAGRLAEGGCLPLVLSARLCDLRPRFLPKGRVGRGYRAVARNGRVLLASDVAVEELCGRFGSVRLQTWHKVILPGDFPTPYGLLLCIRLIPEPKGRLYHTRLAERTLEWHEAVSHLRLDVGGGMVLDFACAAVN
jgi:hypothetical protein